MDAALVQGMDKAKFEHASPDDRVAVVVTTPLTTNEVWTPFEPGALKVFVDGKVVSG